jgi:hypothetical protein
MVSSSKDERCAPIAKPQPQTACGHGPANWYRTTKYVAVEPFVPCVILRRPTSFMRIPMSGTAFSFTENIASQIISSGHDSGFILQLLNSCNSSEMQ